MMKLKEVDYKKIFRYTSLWDSEETFLINCGLYEEEERICKNPRKKCKNCPVYHGFKSRENLYKKNKLKNEIHSE